MPAKGKGRMSEATRKTIAAGRLLGKSAKEIGKETGLAEGTIRNNAFHPKTLSMMQEMKSKHSEQLEAGFKKALDRTDKLLASTDETVALRACQTWFELIQAGDPPIKAVTSERRGDFTYEELVEEHIRATRSIVRRVV